MFSIWDLGSLLSFDGNYKMKKRLSATFRIKIPKDKEKKKYSLSNFHDEIKDVSTKNQLKEIVSQVDNNRITLYENTLSRRKLKYTIKVNQRIMSKKKLGKDYEKKIKEKFTDMFDADIIDLENEYRGRIFKTMIPDIIYQNGKYKGIIEVKYKVKYTDGIPLSNLTQLVIYMLFYNKSISEGYLLECFSPDNINITYISMKFAIDFFNKFIKNKLINLIKIYKKINKK